jgi:hypothetical protein
MGTLLAIRRQINYLCLSALEMKKYLTALLLVAISHLVAIAVVSTQKYDDLGISMLFVFLIGVILSTILSIIVVVSVKNYSSTLFLYACFLGISFSAIFFYKFDFEHNKGLSIINGIPIIAGLSLLLVHVKDIRKKNT